MIHTLSHGGVLFVTLNNPATRNALNDAMLAGLREALDTACADQSIRALVLRGAQGNFCAGGDFTQFKALMSTSRGDLDPISVSNRAFGAVLERMAACEVPLIAAVEGAAMGGGCGLVAICDIVLATQQARFAMPEVTIGLPPAQIAPFVASRLGCAAASRLMLTGARLTAEEAKAVGLVDEIASDCAGLRACALRWIGQLGRAEPAAARATKRILARARYSTLSDALDLAAQAFATSLRGGSAEEGIAAFASKRPPNWHLQLAEWPELP